VITVCNLEGYRSEVGYTPVSISVKNYLKELLIRTFLMISPL